jgi:DNA-binding beta-propeller fold protein YncE
VDGADVWVVNRDGNSVTELNAADGGVVRILSAASYGFDSPDGIVADGAQLWVANGDSVTELNAADGRLVRTLSGRSYGFDVPAGIAVDGSQLWTANEDGNSVTELSAG